MTHKKYSVERVVLLKLVPVVLLACILPAGALAQNTQVLGKKELKALLASAKTSGDELKLAAHYRAKAEQLNAKSQDFAQHMKSKQGVPCNCPGLYRDFSMDYAREAREADALAQKHEQLAQRYALYAQEEHK